MKVFICENTAIGFFSAVFDAYTHKVKPNLITSLSTYQPSFTTEVIKTLPDEEKATRVKQKIISLTGFTSEVKNIELVLLSNSALKETVCFNYINLIIEKGARVDKMLAEVAVIEFNDLKQKVLKELHHMKGFLRFIETENGVLYAHYEPDNDITALLAPHFKERIKIIPFIIHDVKRNILALYNGKEIKVVYCDTPLAIYLSPQEKEMQTLWKRYFESVNIESRKNKKQQDNYLPRRYRKHMNEFI